MLTATCDIALDRSPEVARRLSAHYAEHGNVTREPAGTRIAIAYGNAILNPRRDGIAVRVEADEEAGLAYMKMGLARHLRTFARDERLPVRWEGDGPAGMLPPYFREMTVVGASDLTPAMRRIVLAGDDIERFARGGLHVRLTFAPEGRKPEWPVLGEDGCPCIPESGEELATRYYTIRHIDLGRGEVTIDMLRHDGDATPGARFAARAGPGELVGMSGPAGSGVPEARDLHLFGDETAIPAIARICEAVPPDARIRATIEIAGPEEMQPIIGRADITVDWLHRGRDERLADRARLLASDNLGSDAYIWAGCEFADFREIRRHCRQTLKLPRERHLVTAYWRKDAVTE